MIVLMTFYGMLVPDGNLKNQSPISQTCRQRKISQNPSPTSILFEVIMRIFEIRANQKFTTFLVLFCCRAIFSSLIFSNRNVIESRLQ